MTDVVITGRGAVTALGSAGELWEGLLSGTSGIADGVGAITGWDADEAVGPRVARRMDRYCQMAVAAANAAAAEAGLPEGADPERVGVIVGTGIGGMTTMQDTVQAWTTGSDRDVSPHFVTMIMPNAAAGHIAMRLGAHGPGLAVASACATGAHAIGEGMRMIERGDADVVVCGGAEATIVGVALAAFRRMGASSPTGQSRPFDKDRDGFVMGEGAAVVVLERADHAEARGATPLARVVGYGATSDAYHITMPSEDGAGAVKAMREALADADASPDAVGWISAHGTGTQLNDLSETRAIKTVFNGSGPPPVSSQKSHLGHTLGAAGAIEAIASIEALRHGILPPTINLATPDPECDLDYIPAGRREAPGLELVLSNSFGFGGQNACLALAKA